MTKYVSHGFLSQPLRLFAALLTLLGLFLLLAPSVSAKTYVITDGDITFTCTASTTDPSDIQKTEKLNPGEYDNDTTSGGSFVAICRAPEIRLRYRGSDCSVTSTGETVGELLANLGLEIDSNDTLSHPLDATVTDGMELVIDHTVTREETYTITIPHETVCCSDASLPEGVEEIHVQGQDGELLNTATVTYVNGQETGRQVIRTKQTIAPVTEIIGQGTGKIQESEVQDMPIIQDGYIIMPSGEILTYYKTDYVTATGYTHTDAGCDMITSTGTTVHYGTAAVDPRFIPYGTRMLIVSHDGERYYGIATAEDCGGAIKRDRMDLYFPTYQECIEFGRRRCTIYFLG